jgi:hypothetical protein
VGQGAARSARLIRIHTPSLPQEDRMDRFKSTVAEELDDETAGPPSAADTFFYVTFIIAIAAVISQQGWYAPGL